MLRVGGGAGVDPEVAVGGKLLPLFHAAFFAFFSFQNGDGAIDFFFAYDSVAILVHHFGQYAVMGGDTTIRAFFVEEMFRKDDKYGGENEGGVDVTGSHPSHGEHDCLFGDVQFQVFFGGFAELHRDEFRTDVQHNHHQSGEEFAVVQIHHMFVNRVEHHFLQYNQDRNRCQETRNDEGYVWAGVVWFLL